MNINKDRYNEMISDIKELKRENPNTDKKVNEILAFFVATFMVLEDIDKEIEAENDVQ